MAGARTTDTASDSATAGSEAEAAAKAAAEKAKAEADKAKADYLDFRQDASLAAILAGRVTVPDIAADTTSDLIKVIERYRLPVDGFCQLLALVLEELDRIELVPGSDVADGPGQLDGSNPADGLGRITGWAAPAVSFAGSVTMPGRAELVRVEEEFVGYSPGEISYIHTVMPGERRLRETRAANTQETEQEYREEDEAEHVDESSSSTKSELKSEIESELKSHFGSKLSATASGEGGATVGVFKFSGKGGADGLMDLSADTTTRSDTEALFAQEIVRKAVERTSRKALQRRVTKSQQSYSATDTYEITNETTKPVNGTYVFLNKHVAITETVVGVRAFLEAKLLAPGRSLVAARRSQQRAVVDLIGERPRFDITPADITPANYMRLAGQFRASNVEPPPAPVVSLTRVYKTDSAAATAATDSFSSRKIAETLMPLFGQYQRYAIIDDIALPEGYKVLNVGTAISHGANGVSLPAHLPLTLIGAGLYTGASFAPFAVGILGIAFLPTWLWSVVFAASPILHYNTDSSSVTITVGTEAQDSNYYFFPPEELMAIAGELLQAISAASPGLVEDIRAMALQRIDEMRTAVEQIPEVIGSHVADAVNGAVDRIRNVLNLLVPGAPPPAPDDVISAITDIGQVSLSLPLSEEIMAVFRPLIDFVGDVAGMLPSGIGEAIRHAVVQLLDGHDNNQRLTFTGALGRRDKLPVAINALALNPGVTITLSACLLRTRAGLARWQLRTFEALYQAYLQQMAAWESQFFSSAPQAPARSPGHLRRDEQVALKERIIAALDALHPDGNNAIAITRLELFEHAIDWDSMSYQLFTYGPSEKSMALENSAVLAGADEDRRQFLLASWAQIMVPLQPDDGLAAQFLDYLRGGTGSVAAAVSAEPGDVPETDELTALYRDLVLSRSLIGDNPPSGEPRFVTLPTDLVALFEPELASNLPHNSALP